MKNMMKKSVVSLLLLGAMTVVSAQDIGSGKASQELGKKIAMEVMQEIQTEASKSGQQPTPEYFGKQLIVKMREHLDEMKAAGAEDCVELYGKEKSENCSCVTGKTDYEEVFGLMEKSMADPKNDMKAESEALEKKMTEVYKSCDLDIAVAKKAGEDAAKKLQK
ncbi:MAG: hypothetical protein Q4A74_06080 [Cardiobacteriaceae bacterium]|nr:hypothetical protein [Cardiobacteriaceae bacterium]